MQLCFIVNAVNKCQVEGFLDTAAGLHIDVPTKNPSHTDAYESRRANAAYTRATKYGVFSREKNTEVYQYLEIRINPCVRCPRGGCFLVSEVRLYSCTRRDLLRKCSYKGASLIRNRAHLGPYSRTMPRAIW